MIRAIPTTTNDRIYCKVLGQGAVHGAFAGFTGCTVGLVNTHYVYLPIPVIIQVTCLSFLILYHNKRNFPSQQSLLVQLSFALGNAVRSVTVQPLYVMKAHVGHDLFSEGALAYDAV